LGSARIRYPRAQKPPARDCSSKSAPTIQNPIPQPASDLSSLGPQLPDAPDSFPTAQAPPPKSWADEKESPHDDRAPRVPSRTVSRQAMSPALLRLAARFYPWFRLE